MYDNASSIADIEYLDSDDKELVQIATIFQDRDFISDPISDEQVSS